MLDTRQATRILNLCRLLQDEISEIIDRTDHLDRARQAASLLSRFALVVFLLSTDNDTFDE